MRKTNLTRRVITGLMTCLLLSGSALAQTIIPPSNPDRFLTSATDPSGFPTVNCDMLSTSSGELQAIAWNSTSGVDIEVNDNAGNSLVINIPTGWMPDVVLADDASNLGTNYILGVIYRDITSMKTILETYVISGVGTGPITATLATNVVIGGATGRYFPHIDMFADASVTYNGLPTMTKFVISWDEDNGIGTDVWAGYGDISAISSYSSLFITNSATSGVAHDIAASTNLSTGVKSAFIVTGVDWATATQLLITTMDCSSISLSSTTAAIPLTGHPYLPRIEAMSLYDSLALPATTARWCAVSAVFNSTLSVSNFWRFTNTTTGGVNTSIGSLASVYNWMGAVAGGTGSVSGSFSDMNYTYGWYNQAGRYLSQAVDYTTGALNSSFPFYYQINSGGVGAFGGKAPIAITTSSNSGKATLTAWYDKPVGNIWYKMTGDIGNYKPGQTTSVGSIAMKNYRVFPNPATSQLNVEGVENSSSYTITGINGSQLGSGNLTADKHTIDTKSLPVGIYLLHLNEDGNRKSIRFVKQ